MTYETEDTENPVCPYCGYVETDAWEIDFGHGDAEVSCSSCGKDYLCSTTVVVTYTTTAKKGVAP